MGYSITSRETFEHLNGWLNEIKAQCDPDVTVFLVGNKCDMENQREISIERARAFQKENDIKYMTEASAKSGDNVLNLFKDIAKFMHNRYGLEDDLTDGAGSSNSFAAGASSYSHSGSFTSQSKGKK